MTRDAHRKSQTCGAIQTILLFAFAAVFFFDISPCLFAAERWRVFGNLICTIGCVLMMLGLISLRKVIQISPEPREGGYLVTEGVYRWFRHPIYTAILLIVIGLFLKKPTLVIAMAAAVVIAFLVVKSRFEEKLLAARYPEYVDYKKRAYSVIPGFRG